MSKAGRIRGGVTNVLTVLVALLIFPIFPMYVYIKKTEKTETHLMNQEIKDKQEQNQALDMKLQAMKMFVEKDSMINTFRKKK
jgi:hypothetical protein